MIYFFLLLSAASFFTAYLLWIPMRRSLHARYWPVHPATVIECTVKRQYAKGSVIFTLRVRATYTVDVIRTVSASLPSLFGTSRGGYAHRLTQFFKVGATVPVYVDPQRAEVAILLPGVEWKEWFLLGLSACTGTGALIAALAT
jgi:hypothetical protein